jgi:hypothetical protein
MCICAVCVVAIPAGELRKVKDTNVFAITGVCSVFAYIWLVIILSGWTPNVVTITEAVLTFLFFPVLVISAYAADKVPSHFIMFWMLISFLNSHDLVLILFNRNGAVLESKSTQK